MNDRARRYLSVLGLRPGASITDARAAYRRLAKKNHPDLYPDDRRDRQQLTMMRINEAYMAVTAILSGHGGHGDPEEAGAAGGGGARHGDPTQRGPHESSVHERGPGRGSQTAPGQGGAAGHGAGATGPGRAASAEDGFFGAWEMKARPGESAATRQVGQPRDPAYAYYKQGFRYYNLGATELSRKEAPRLRRKLLKERSLRAYDAYVLWFALRALHYFERSYSYFLVVVDRYPDSPWAPDARWKLRRLEKFTAVYQRICENLSRRSSMSDSSFSIVRGAEPS